MKIKSSASKNEPMPTGNNDPVLPEVIKDLNARAKMGKAKYGTLLRPFNGRSALMDAYQEALDLVMYLKQLIIEEENS